MDLCDVSYCNIDIDIDITRNFDQLDDIEEQGLQFEKYFQNPGLVCSAYPCLLCLSLSALLILVCSTYCSSQLSRQTLNSSNTMSAEEERGASIYICQLKIECFLLIFVIKIK